MKKFIDNHTHLHSCKEPLHSLKDLIILNIFDLDEDLQCLNHEDLILGINYFKSFGLHPNRAHLYELTQVQKEIETHKNEIIAIGETGLDFHYTQEKNIIKKQKESLELQDFLCTQYKKALMIHSRDCPIETILDCIKTDKFVFHSFNYEEKVLKKILDKEGYVSFSGMLTFKNMDYLVDALRYCPKDRFFLETDSPFLLLRQNPLLESLKMEKKYKENQSYYVKYLYEFTSKIKHITIENLQDQLIENFKNLYNVSIL